METTVSIRAGIDWAAIAAIAAVAIALASLWFARRQHRDDLRAQTLPVMSVERPRLWDDGIEVDLINVGAGAARGGWIQLWAMVHVGDVPPTPQELSNLKDRAAAKAEAQVGDIVETFGAIGAGDVRHRPRFLYTDGLRDNSNHHGWLHWRTTSRNAFDDFVVDEGGCPIVAT